VCVATETCDYTSLRWGSESASPLLKHDRFGIESKARLSLPRATQVVVVMRMSSIQKLIWTIVTVALALALYFAFRGYLAPSMLMDFANSMLC